MKFGKTFLLHQIPEWLIYYMNYKHLKKIIKNVDSVINYNQFNPKDLPELISSIVSQFFFELDRDIEKVSGFYNSKFKEYNRRLDKLVHILGYDDTNHTIHHQIDTTDELDEVISILLELRSIYRNLKWFGELNHKGFIKILKKLDKKLTYLTKLANDQIVSDGTGAEPVNLPNNNKEIYLTTRVDALPFANEVDLIHGLDTINYILNELGDQQYDLEQKLHPQNVKSAQGSDSDISSGLEVLKVGSKRRYSFDQEYLEAFYDLIDKDDPAGLVVELDKIPTPRKTLKFLLSLLNKSTLHNSVQCVDALFEYVLAFATSQADLSKVNVFFDKFDLNGRNFFHQHIVSLGKKQLHREQKEVTPGESSEINRLYGNKSGPDGSQLLPIVMTGFLAILARVEADPEFRPLLIAKDNYLRTPLHYAAQYGLKDMSQLMLECLVKWDLITKDLIDDVAVWGDQEGLSPLHLAIIGKHPKTTQNLIRFSPKKQLSCPNLLLLATRLNSLDIVANLIEHGKIDVNYTDLENNNETALYIASKLNFVDIVDFLLDNGANTELGENVFGWTPIFIAAAEGYREVVNHLKDYDAAYDLVDDSGWLPMEHASLRGHLEVADLLVPKNEKLLLYDIDNQNNNVERVPNHSVSTTQSPVASPMIHAALGEEMLLSTLSIDKLPEPNKHAVNEVYKQFKQFDGSSSSINVIEPTQTNGRARLRSRSPSNRRRRVKPIKSFGHRYLNQDESLILITLGTTDLRDHDSPINLNKISMSKTFFTELDTALSLIVTCRSKHTKQVVETPVIIDLPLEDEHGSATEPITFQLTNNMSLEDVIITFDIVPTYQYSNDLKPINNVNAKRTSPKILGRGVALLNSVHTRVGPNLRSLNNRITIPIIEGDSLDILGNINFEYLCVKPFSHEAMNITRSDTYWKQLVSTRVIGHRGLGKNFNTRKSLQLGENTVESFIAAASLGASYVEFDVQLTKDYVPVVYHDFTVAESGVDIPMHAMTAEQFLGLGETNSSKKEKQKHNTDAKFANYSLDDEMLSKYNRPRSMSSYPSAPNFLAMAQFDENDDELDREYKDHVHSRMKLTKTWKDKGFKGNARGLSIASNFVTLKELFKKLPKNIGFNIELKYPMLDEAEQESMGEIAIDLNFYVDTILKVVYDENTTGRDIIFSSFHPDVCLLLSLKQPTIPILFLTEAGTQFMADIRASSLQNAIRFAKKWNLLGIVSAAKTLVKTPRLAQVVKSSGLVCVTYGVENNDPNLAKIQMKAGVDAVIADSVLAVREGLRTQEPSRI